MLAANIGAGSTVGAAGLCLRRIGTPEVVATIAAGIFFMTTVHLATLGSGWGNAKPYLIGLIASVLAGATGYAVRFRFQGPRNHNLLAGDL